MTVSAAEGFTVASSSGVSWSGGGVSDLTTSGDGSAYVTLPSGTVSYANLSIPDFITDIIDGAKFVSLKVTFQEFSNSPTHIQRRAYLTGGTVFTNTSLPYSYSTVTLNGDATYWGISGTPNSIFADLKDGTLKFTIRGDGVNGGAFPNMYINDVDATLTYKLPNTTTASTIMLIP